MCLELCAHLVKLAENIRHRLFHRQIITAAIRTGRHRQWQRRANTRDDIFALGVDQILAIEGVFASRRVSGEGNTGGAVIPHIAEHHGLDIHRRAPACRNAVEPAIGGRARIHPAVEHGTDGAPQLVMRVLREWPAGLFLDNRHVGGDKRFQIVACQTSVIKDATAKLQLLEFVLEQPVINLHHDIGIHLDEAAIAVIGKALVIGAPGQPRNRVVIQPEIEHRIHHPRHRGARTGAHQDKKRVWRNPRPVAWPV